MEKHYEHNRDLHMLLMDFKQAFDSIDRYKYIKKKQAADVPHVSTPSGYLWFRIVDTHRGRGKSISSILKENTVENIWTSERKRIMENSTKR